MKINVVQVSGGLGNQMFQYVYYLMLKYQYFPRNLNCLLILPTRVHNGYELNRVFGIKKYLILNSSLGFLKRYFRNLIAFNEEYNIENAEKLIPLNKTFVYYNGYWQKLKYIECVEHRIRSAFRFNLQKFNRKSSELLGEITNRNSVSMHVRRGDYENDKMAQIVHGGICDSAYYSRAIRYIEEEIEDPFFYIFSDDPLWVKDNLSFLSNSFIVDWNIAQDSWQDMALMSNCAHNIIANSTFSWWSAWLNSNPQKIVIAPQKWFNTIKVHDIIPIGWVQM